MLRLIIGVFGVCAILYALYAGYFYFVQREIIFPRRMIQVPADGALSGRFGAADVQMQWLKIDGSDVDGEVEAWYLPPLTSDGEIVTERSPALIFTHGNGELIDFWVTDVMGLRRLSVGVLLVEYPGYGRSAGQPTQKSVTATMVAAYDWLVTRDDVDAERIVLFGRSVGGGAAAALTRERESAALILFSTFRSVRSMARDFYLPPFLVLDPFDNLAAVHDYANPVLVIHGMHDEVIPYGHGVALYEAARNGELMTLACGHNDCVQDWEIFWPEIERFLQRAGVLS